MTRTEAKPTIDYRPPEEPFAADRVVGIRPSGFVRISALGFRIYNLFRRLLFGFRFRDLVQNWDMALVLLLGLGIGLVFGLRDFLFFWHLTHPAVLPPN